MKTWNKGDKGYIILWYHSSFKIVKCKIDHRVRLSGVKNQYYIRTNAQYYKSYFINGKYIYEDRFEAASALVKMVNKVYAKEFQF